MLDEKMIKFIRDRIGPDGKMVITDDLTEKQKEKFNYLNNLNINISEFLSRQEGMLSGKYAFADADDDTEVIEVDTDTNESTNNSINNTSTISETGEAVNDLDDFF